MKKIITTLISFLLFTNTILGTTGIMAYEKGRTAQLNIEVTKIKSNNYLDLIVDRNNKKFYAELTSDMDLFSNRVYITDSIKGIRSFTDIVGMFPNKVISLNNKKYLEVDYSFTSTPKQLYFWLIQGDRIKKVYTGRIIDEYVDLSRADGHIIIESVNDTKDTLYKLDRYGVVLKIAKISHRKESNQNIVLDIRNIKYFLEGKEFKEKIPISLYFENNKQLTNLNNIHNSDTLYGKIDSNINIPLESKEYILKSEVSNLSSYPIEIKFSTRPRLMKRGTNIDTPPANFYSFKPYSLLWEHNGVIKVYAKTLNNDIFYIKKILWWGYIENHLPSSEVIQEDSFFGARIFDTKSKQIFFYRGNKQVKKGPKVKEYKDLNLSLGKDSISYSIANNIITCKINREEFKKVGIDKIKTEFYGGFLLPNTVLEILFTEDPKPDLLVNTLQNFEFGKVKNGSIGEKKTAEIVAEYNKNYDCLVETEKSMTLKYIGKKNRLDPTKFVTAQINSIIPKEPISVDERFNKRKFLITAQIVDYTKTIPGYYQGRLNVKVTLVPKNKSGKF